MIKIIEYKGTNRDIPSWEERADSLNNANRDAKAYSAKNKKLYEVTNENIAIVWWYEGKQRTNFEIKVRREHRQW